MVSKKRHSPWIWIPNLCAAEEIPFAVVTYVALLMFLQFGSDETMASIYSGLLFLPWVMKSYLRSKVRNAGFFKRHIHIAEGMIFLCLMGIAVYLTEFRVRDWGLFIFMFVLSLLCAWHELIARMYYNRMLYPRQQELYNKTKMLSSQMTLIVTYGVLIIIAGFFEVFFRSYQKAWAMESSLVAGGFLLFLLLNFITLQNPRIHNPYRYESLIGAFKNEMHVIERIKQKPNVARVIFSIIILLLPQALLFNTRVFFLMAPATNGGLDCSVQDVGFAQGTIGVVAFSLGIGLGRLLNEKLGEMKTFWPMVIVLTLSPLFYMLMSQNPLVGNMVALCCMTSLAQFCFGFGLNVCLVFVHFISGNRYRNTINYLYVPMIAGAMIVPLMASGWLSQLLTYDTYFLVLTCMAPIIWLVLLCCKTKKVLTNNEFANVDNKE